MPDWNDAPVTKAALWPCPGERGPSALEREWSERLRHPRDVIFLSAGAFERQGAPHSWTALCWSVGSETDPQPPAPPVLTAPPASVERLLSPLAHEARIRIMQALYRGPRTSAALAQALSLERDDLHYHLEPLIEASYLQEQDGSYDLTALGCQMLITVASIAHMLVEDAGEGGLPITSSWND